MFYIQNHGLQRATAPYVLFIDSDDWTSSKYTSHLLNCIKNNTDVLPICGY
ncbi:MAG: glycosyltransferase family 2 protein, partial [Clostridia bacterium]|nr:glycosyltransferase family 2 protein [Clostridia bacterium]